MNILLISLILVPLIAGIAVFLLKPLKVSLSLIATTYCATVSVGLMIFSPRLVYSILVLDGLSQLFLLIIGLLGFLILLYSIDYFKDQANSHYFYALFCLLISALNSAVLSANLLTLFIFLEAGSFITYFLIAYDRQDTSFEAAFKYFMLGSLASILLLLGIGLLSTLAGTMSLPLIAMNSTKLNPIWLGFIFSLFLAGFALKSGLAPFPFWLPDAYSVAPAPVLALSSGILIKVLGFYCLIRMFFNILPLSINFGASLLLLGSLSILLGGFMALAQNNLKRLYAYSSISQIGYIALGLGLLSPLGILGALLHLFSHAIFKPLLFLCCGAIEKQTGTNNMDELGGLFFKMPLTSLATLIANLSLAGIPPFSGFWSKLLIILACVRASRLDLAFIAAIGALLSLGYVLKVQKIVFFDKLPPKLAFVKENGSTMLVAILSLTVICVLTGLLNPLVVSKIINPAAIAVINKLAYATFAAGNM